MNRKNLLVSMALILVIALAMGQYAFPLLRTVAGQPQISVNPSIVNVGLGGFWQGTVVISGAGFTPSGDVLISCGNGIPNDHVIANGEGRVYFLCAESLPPGTYWFFAQDSSTHEASNQVPLAVSSLVISPQSTTTVTTITMPETTTAYSTTITNNVTVQNVIFNTVYSNSTFTIFDVTNVGTTVTNTATFTEIAFTSTTMTGSATFTISENTIITTTQTGTQTQTEQTWSTTTIPITQTVTEQTWSTTTIPITQTVTEQPVTYTTVTSPNYTVTIGARNSQFGMAHVMFRTNPATGLISVPAVAWFADGQGSTLQTTLTYPIIAISPYGAYTFSHWGTQGDITVQCPTCQFTTMRANGDGVLTAYFITNSP